MDRNELHEQIRELADKINHLNDNLGRSKKIHPVEIDLLHLYGKELLGMVDQLAGAVGLVKRPASETVTNNVAPTAAPVEKPQAVAPPVAPKKEEPTIAPPVIVEEGLVEKPEPKVDVAPEPAPVEEPKAVVEEKAEEPVAPPTPPVVEEPAAAADSVEETVAAAPEPVVVEPPTVTVEEKATPVVEEVVPPATVEQEVVAEEEPIKEEDTTPPPRRSVTFNPFESATTINVPSSGSHLLFSNEEEEPAAPSINDKFAQQDSTNLFNKAKRADARNLKESMDIGERFMFLKDLFGANQEMFDRATEYLGSVGTLEEARIYMDTVLRPKYNWEGKEHTVRQFFELVEHRFIK